MAAFLHCGQIATLTKKFFFCNGLPLGLGHIYGKAPVMTSNMKRLYQQQRVLFHIIAMAAIAFVLAKCQSAEHATSVSAIQPPFSKIKIPRETYTFENVDGYSLETEAGTVIEIPENCFADQDGKLIEGPIDFVFREIHKPHEVLASGIPMHHAQDGQDGHLITAGMFEMQGYHNGERVAFANGKSVDVIMPSLLPDDQVNFYALDSQSGKWTEEAMEAEVTDYAMTIPAKVRTILDTQLNEPTPPVEAQETDDVINLSFRDDRLEGFKTTLWKFGGDDDAKNPFNYEAFREGTYDVEDYDISASEEGPKLHITFNLAKTTQEPATKLETVLTPVLVGEDFDKAMEFYQENQENYKTLLKRQKELGKAYKSSYKVLRAFKMNRFGYFNWDCWSGRQNLVQDKVILTQHGEKVEVPARIFLLRKAMGQKGVINQQNYDGIRSIINYSTDEKNASHWVVVLPDDEISIITPEQFTKQKMADGTRQMEVSETIQLTGMNQLGEIIANI